MSIDELVKSITGNVENLEKSIEENYTKKIDELSKSVREAKEKFIGEVQTMISQDDSDKVVAKLQTFVDDANESLKELEEVLKQEGDIDTPENRAILKEFQDCLGIIREEYRNSIKEENEKRRNDKKENLQKYLEVTKGSTDSKLAANRALVETKTVTLNELEKLVDELAKILVSWKNMKKSYKQKIEILFKSLKANKPIRGSADDASSKNVQTAKIGINVTGNMPNIGAGPANGGTVQFVINGSGGMGGAGNSGGNVAGFAIPIGAMGINTPQTNQSQEIEELKRIKKEKDEEIARLRETAEKEKEKQRRKEEEEEEKRRKESESKINALQEELDRTRQQFTKAKEAEDSARKVLEDAIREFNAAKKRNDTREQEEAQKAVDKAKEGLAAATKEKEAADGKLREANELLQKEREKNKRIQNAIKAFYKIKSALTNGAFYKCFENEDSKDVLPSATLDDIVAVRKSMDTFNEALEKPFMDGFEEQLGKFINSDENSEIEAFNDIKGEIDLINEQNEALIGARKSKIDAIKTRYGEKKAALEEALEPLKKQPTKGEAQAGGEAESNSNGQSDGDISDNDLEKAIKAYEEFILSVSNDKPEGEGPSLGSVIESEDLPEELRGIKSDFQSEVKKSEGLKEREKKVKERRQQEQEEAERRRIEEEERKKKEEEERKKQEKITKALEKFNTAKKELTQSFNSCFNNDEISLVDGKTLQDIIVAYEETIKFEIKLSKYDTELDDVTLRDFIEKFATGNAPNEDMRKCKDEIDIFDKRCVNLDTKRKEIIEQIKTNFNNAHKKLIEEDEDWNTLLNSEDGYDVSINDPETALKVYTETIGKLDKETKWALESSDEVGMEKLNKEKSEYKKIQAAYDKIKEEERKKQGQIDVALEKFSKAKEQTKLESLFNSCFDKERGTSVVDGKTLQDIIAAEKSALQFSKKLSENHAELDNETLKGFIVKYKYNSTVLIHDAFMEDYYYEIDIFDKRYKNLKAKKSEMVDQIKKTFEGARKKLIENNDWNALLGDESETSNSDSISDPANAVKAYEEFNTALNGEAKEELEKSSTDGTNEGAGDLVGEREDYEKIKKAYEIVAEAKKKHDEKEAERKRKEEEERRRKEEERQKEIARIKAIFNNAYIELITDPDWKKLLDHNGGVPGDTSIDDPETAIAAYKKFESAISSEKSLSGILSKNGNPDDGYEEVREKYKKIKNKYTEVKREADNIKRAEGEFALLERELQTSSRGAFNVDYVPVSFESIENGNLGESLDNASRDLNGGLEAFEKFFAGLDKEFIRAVGKEGKSATLRDFINRTPKLAPKIGAISGYGKQNEKLNKEILPQFMKKQNDYKTCKALMDNIGQSAEKFNDLFDIGDGSSVSLKPGTSISELINAKTGIEKIREGYNKDTRYTGLNKDYQGIINQKYDKTFEQKLKAISKKMQEYSQKYKKEITMLKNLLGDDFLNPVTVKIGGQLLKIGMFQLCKLLAMFIATCSYESKGHLTAILANNLVASLKSNTKSVFCPTFRGFTTYKEAYMQAKAYFDGSGTPGRKIFDSLSVDTKTGKPFDAAVKADTTVSGALNEAQNQISKHFSKYNSLPETTYKEKWDEIFNKFHFERTSKLNELLIVKNSKDPNSTPCKILFGGESIENIKAYLDLASKG